MSDFEQALRGNKLSVTPHRIAVLHEISQNPHCSAAELIEKVSSRIGKISKQAIYDILETFVEKGLTRRIQPSGSVALFEARVGDNHHHLICRKCRTCLDVDCAAGKTPCLQACDDHGFAIDEAEVIYWGICPQCKNS